MATRWLPNFRLNYWLCLVFAGLGVVGALYGLYKGELEWFVFGAGVGILALLVQRHRGRGKFPIPGMKNPAEGDFAEYGDPPPEEAVTVVEEPGQTEELAPPEE